MRLTDIGVRKLAAPARGQAKHFDDTLVGFGVRVSQGGTKSFILVHGPARQLVTLGRVGVITLAQAREKARHILAEKTLGKIDAPTVALGAARELFFAAYENRVRPRTLSEYRRLFKHLTMFEKRPVGGIAPHEMAAAIDRLQNTPIEQNHAFATARTFFRFCVRRGLLVRSPLEGMPLPSRVIARDRVLSDDELKAVFAAAVGIGYPFGFVILLLILTGQRKGEMASLEWTWIDDAKRTITIPASVTKNRREHTFPYGQGVADIFVAIPRAKPTLFSLHNWDARTVELRAKAGIPHFVLHDLRRTYASGMAALGVAPHVVEKLLNHVTGTVSGVAAVYNRYRYADEMADAVAKWEDHLWSLTRSV